MKKRLFSILTALALCLSLLSVTALAEDTVRYLAADGSTQDCNNYTVVSSSETAITWDTGWYAVQDEVTISNAVTVSGDVHLILTDNSSLTVNGGITGKGDLTIYGQSEGSGQLTATGGTAGNNSYGIYVNGGNITINGGVVSATGGTATATGSASGISYGIYASNGSITISGGSVNATGGSSGMTVGISSASLTINGGVVTAAGGNGVHLSAGITSDTLTINGGTVTATNGGGDISCGIYAYGNITIKAGTVIATNSGGDISCGIYAYGEITINGGVVSATGGAATDESCGIAADSHFKISGGTVTATGGMASEESYGLYAGGSNMTIKGGHVTARTLATSGTYIALNAAPNLNVYGGYYWRTSPEKSFVACIDEDTAYTYDSIHTYVEFFNRYICTITLDSNYSGGESSTMTTGTEGTLTSLPTLTRDSYTFDGWFTAATGGTEVTTETVFNGNTTIYAHWTVEPAPVPIDPPIVVKLPEEGGSVIVLPSHPAPGIEVTVTPSPNEGYEVDEVIVTDKNGDPVEVTDNGDGTYSFTQPIVRVTIKVVFREAEKIPFVDVPAGEYYYDAVQWAVENRITDGTSDTTFSPNAPCTRAQIVTFLWRAAGCPAPQSSEMPFEDVVRGSYYETAVLWAVEKGITDGTSDSKFAPDEICTRAQMAVFLCRLASGKAVSSTIAFTDVSADAYYAEAVQWAVENGIADGVGDNKFAPDGICTRGQMVTFLYRFLVK